MNCNEITQLIRTFYSKKKPLDGALDRYKSNVSLGLSLKNKIGNLITEYEKIYPALAKDFFQVVEFYSAILKEFFDGNEDDTAPYLGREIGEYYNYPLDRANYYQFLRLLSAFLARHKITQEWAADYLNKLFLNNYQTDPKHPLQIRSSILPECLKHNFGLALTNINIRIDSLSGNAFEYLSGGRVEIDSFKNTEGKTERSMLGKKMVSGTIRVKNAEGIIGHEMENGTIIIDSLSEGNIAGGGKGGTIYVKSFKTDITRIDEMSICFGASGGTYLVNEIPDQAKIMIGAREKAIVIVRCRKNQIFNNQGSWTFDGGVAYYDEGLDKIEFIDSKYQPQIINNEQEFVLTQADPENPKIGIIPEMWSEDISFESASECVLVIKKIQGNEVGKGQKGGIIILDDQAITYEEACQRVSKDRTGGVILYLRKWSEPKKIGKMPIGNKKKAEFVEIR